MKAKADILFFQNAKFDKLNQITVRLWKITWGNQKEYILERQTYAGSDPDCGDPTMQSKEILPDRVEISGAIGLPNHKNEFKTFMRDEFAIRIAIQQFDELYGEMAARFGDTEY